ncbi:hypothetical protein BGX27_007581 [Mortierella sp. AM989]|nr:hypothetical protein BGX27_007581 [Mortierella sp. AM989]
MATFHSLTPSMGSRQTRQAPDMFSIELELALPQDYFLPAEDIQAQVWTNIIHRLNPDGPEVWSAVPMKLSHVIPGKCIAVFATRLQPTGRGDFGLTARWKSHKDSTEWQWAPTAEPTPSDLSGDQKVTKDVSIIVRVPRNISGTSSWTIGPQSMLVFGQNKPRIEGYGLGAGVGGPGLYLGNHAAATRARISGYESVLSLVGDLLDFDENIPESDKDLNKNVWIEQANATTPPKRFSSLSRPLSISSHNALSFDTKSNGDASAQKKSLARRMSVQEFMENREPGSISDETIAAVVDDPEDGPRLTRKSSVTEMMVQLPPTSNTSRRLSRTSASMKPVKSIDELEQGVEQETSPASATIISAAPNARSKTKGKKGAALADTTAAEAAVVDPSPIPTPPTSSKKKKKSSAASTTANTAAALPPTPTEKSSEKANTSSQQTPVSPTVSSLEVAAAVDPAGANEKASKADVSILTSSLSSSLKISTNGNNDGGGPSTSNNTTPPSSAKVVSGLYHQTYDSQQALSSLSGEDDSSKTQAKRPFEHKVISVAPGAHNIISDAILKEAVDFLRAEVGAGKKVLVHCRDGNGRSGSVAVAYIASQLQLNAQQEEGNTQDGGYYDQALNEVWKWKCDVYPHKGLRQSIERINWSGGDPAVELNDVCDVGCGDENGVDLTVCK